ncbi:ragulator complex protein LAMTOR5-like [Haliotis rufescens]|uniref:ragulator complex protein LAMTOR5-like n=1 Tax=Haliotis rufescens TaxID=6454 RepID=UPI001EB0845D|nr:ragulator complex protein LAMTOR5-like [Haliotis rufescens]
MEKGLEKHMDETFKLPGVAAVLCTDGHGLCLGAKGSAPKHSSGPIATLAAMAGDLGPSGAASPVVCIESEAGSVLIKSCDNLTVAVFKAT